MKGFEIGVEIGMSENGEVTVVPFKIDREESTCSVGLFNRHKKTTFN